MNDNRRSGGLIELTRRCREVKRLRNVFHIILDTNRGQFRHLAVDGLEVLPRFLEPETQFHKDAGGERPADQRGEDEEITANDAAPSVRRNGRRRRSRLLTCLP